jgi:hypothetical protein
MGELKRLNDDLRALARRQPLLARTLGVLVSVLGIGGVISLGPWQDTWYPVLFVGCLALVGIGLRTAMNAASAPADVKPFLGAVNGAALPFTVCLGCLRVLVDEPRCEACPAPELFEVRAEIDRRLVLTRVRGEYAAPQSPP